MLTTEIKRSLKELDLGLKGDLTITESMESLMNAIFLGVVPSSWEKLAYPSLNPLAAWYADLLQRIKELEGWVSEFQLPSVVWLPGLFNPQSFLTAIMQTTARKNEWPLDRMVLTIEVLKKPREECNTAPREGAYIHGLFMEERVNGEKENEEEGFLDTEFLEHQKKKCQRLAGLYPNFIRTLELRCRYLLESARNSKNVAMGARL
ncbi:hypothetical protein HMI55_005135 [Coelomomyces lativittatus]|nr:hypothetical protein HMI55_005135 [Coelomomyces lativittatus]